MALGAAHKQLSHVRLLYSAKHELITLAATAGACFAMHISANRSDFPLSLEHGRSSRTIGQDFAPIFGKDCTFENTKEVGGTRPKRGLYLGNRLRKTLGEHEKREAEAGLPGGSRDLLSLQGGHAGNDTSAHTH
jgi:hypothetical protein